MSGTINRILLSEDANRTGKATLELSVGQCVMVEIYSEPNKIGERDRIVFQMQTERFRQWARAFSLFSECL